MDLCFTFIDAFRAREGIQNSRLSFLCVGHGVPLQKAGIKGDKTTQLGEDGVIHEAQSVAGATAFCKPAKVQMLLFNLSCAWYLPFQVMDFTFCAVAVTAITCKTCKERQNHLA